MFENSKRSVTRIVVVAAVVIILVRSHLLCRPHALTQSHGANLNYSRVKGFTVNNTLSNELDTNTRAHAQSEKVNNILSDRENIDTDCYMRYLAHM